MNPRLISLVLFALLILPQYPLWFGKGGLLRVSDLEGQLEQQKQVNESLRLRNQQLEGDVRSLSEGVEAIEERARNDFGMIKKGEVFIQLIEPRSEPRIEPQAESSPAPAQ
ncbi:MAG: cell division protein FtsB [Gammaproteobacteria bacterium]|nr:cell division protein FtsB [Gammaproteobacteria bacterium]